MSEMQPLVTKKALDALVVSPEIFLNTAKETLAHANAGTLGEVPLIFGHGQESMRPMGTIYIIPKSKRRAAFPLLWDTERNKHRYPGLFQALHGPFWGEAFNFATDANGTIHLDSDSMSDLGSDITDLPEMIDAYLDERVQLVDHIDDPQPKLEDGVMLLFRPLFSAVDRCVSTLISEKMDEKVTEFVRGLYGFAPGQDFPAFMATLATEGVPEGYGIPPVKTASVSAYRYIAAPSKKDAKAATKLYTTFQVASSYSKDKTWPVFRVVVEDGEPDWKSAREVRSEAEDIATTSKFASTDSSWLHEVTTAEFGKMASNLQSVLVKTIK